MKIFIISTVILCLYIALDLIFNDQMWNANTELTVYLQANQFQGEKSFFLFFSYSLYGLPCLALIAFLFMDNKLGALLYGCMILVSAAFNSLLKNFYHQPRPFWVELDIIPFECSTEFGKPSGHAMSSSVMCFLLPSILFPAIWANQQNKKYPIHLRVIAIFIIVFWTFMTGLARVFMGVHTFGQIILGWFYSGYMIINYMVYIHDPLTNYLKSCLVNGSQIQIKAIYLLGLFMFAWICIAILFLELDGYVFITPEEANQWMTVVYKKCSKQTTIYDIHSAPALQNTCFTSSLYILILFSCFLGLKISKGYYDEGKFSEAYEKLNLKQKIFRILLLLLTLALIVPFFFIKSQNVYVIAVCQVLPISILGGLLLTFGYSKVLTSCKLSIDGDFVQIMVQPPPIVEGNCSEMGVISS